MAFRTLQVVAVVLWLVWQCNVTVIGGCPRVGDMAGIAFFRGIKVPWVWTDGRYAVVTGRTRAKHLRVIDGEYGRKHIRGMAIFADIRCQNMCRVFAGRVCVVMAANAVTGDIHVIEIGG